MCKRVRDASIYASKKISLKFLFLSDIFFLTSSLKKHVFYN